jgi:hypothetical protein
MGSSVLIPIISAIQIIIIILIIITIIIRITIIILIIIIIMRVIIFNTNSYVFCIPHVVACLVVYESLYISYLFCRVSKNRKVIITRGG